MRTMRWLTPTSLGLSVVSASVFTLFGLVLSDPSSIGVKAVPEVAAIVKSAPPVFGPSIEVPGVSRAAGSVLDLEYELDRVDYTLALVRNGAGDVPRIFVSTLPDDMGAIDAPAERKRLFIKMTLPLILAVNETILADRARLSRVIDEVRSGQALAAKDEVWLAELTARYEVEPGNFEALLKRVDIVPPSLALAQAAVESGWGTSRFVQEANALYGERLFAEGFGLVPDDRDLDAAHEVRAFPRLIDSVASYVHNLNTHEAYASFRAERAALRRGRVALEGLTLIDWLQPYSEDRAGYVTTVRRVIKGNQLWQFDLAELGGTRVAALALPERRVAR